MFGSNLQNWVFDEVTYFEVPRIWKSHFQQLVCMCLWVCYQHNSKTNHCQKFKFDIQNIHCKEMPHEIFYKDCLIYKQNNWNALRALDSFYHHFNKFNCSKINEYAIFTWLKLYFCRKWCIMPFIICLKDLTKVYESSSSYG